MLNTEKYDEVLENIKKYFEERSLNTEDAVFKSSCWVCGGMRGGSCWGGVADRAVESEPENELLDLEQFMIEYYPNTSFRVYAKMLKKVQYRETFSNEYYGNYTEYRYKCISFEDVAAILSEE